MKSARSARVIEAVSGRSWSSRATTLPVGRKLNSTCLRLCNNHLVSLQGLGKAAYHVLEAPSELLWLDASCNQLATIDDIITDFPKLQVRIDEEEGGQKGTVEYRIRG